MSASFTTRARPIIVQAIPPNHGLGGQAAAQQNLRMPGRDQHKWGRDRVQPGSSEWPSTGYSTMIGEWESKTPAAIVKRRLRREVPLGNVIVSIIIFLVVGGLAVHVLAHFLRA